jgi:hypothetical protein
MATTEERFQALEQFRTETLHAYTDMAYRITMLQGLIEDSIKRQTTFRNEMADFRIEMNTFRASVDERFNRIDSQLTTILQKLDEGKE